MEKKNLLFVAAAMVMAGCASDDMIGDNGATQSDNQVIGFNMNVPATTRADGTADDASKLHNMFIVWGEKNETNGTEATTANKVFENYKVEYKAGTANTTLSNTINWEYVGIAPFTANVSPVISQSSQTIKYWDYQADSYTFTAVSVDPDDITNNNVVIAKKLSGSTVYDKGYDITVKTEAAAGKIYVADRQPIAKGTGTDRNAANAYGGRVQLTFRNFRSKIRFGIYETVPGYKVVITGIKYNDGNEDQTHTASTTKTFGIGGKFITAGANTKYTVTYGNATSGHENEAQVSIANGASTADYLTTEGTTWLSNTTGIAENTNKPTYDNGGAYTYILPNTSNSTNLKLQIAYKLVSEDTGEVIEFKETNGSTTTEIYRTVEVPAEYCKWKSNYAYTYIFKISDKSADLYPITFDAVVVDSQIGNQETITEVSEPSITTCAVKSDGTTLVTDQEEYQGGNFIYASVVDKTVTESSKLSGNTVILTTGSNVNLYTITSTKGSKASVKPDITEKAVANCIANGVKDDNSNPTTWTTTDVNESELKATKATGTVVTTVPAEDKTNRTMSALKWTATADTYYAVEYINGGTKTYKIVKVGAAE